VSEREASTAPHQVLDALLDALNEGEARAALTRCCGSTRWVDAMLSRRPFRSHEALLEAADEVWQGLERDDYLEAFSHHPQIGAELATLRARFAATAGWALDEQASVQCADEQTLLSLRDENQRYLARFGYLFIVCASGKSASEMLALLRARLANTPAQELPVAAREQAKITRLRLQKLALPKEPA
jgi:2-oxo-4-hydroxy-4-carboxy-5-ureidoimidazoline decarboxylase